MRRFLGFGERSPVEPTEKLVTYRDVQEILDAEAKDIELHAILHGDTAPDPLATSGERAIYNEEMARLQGRTEEVRRIGVRLVQMYTKED